MSDSSVPNSLRYTFKEDLDWFPIKEDSESNYLVGGLLYKDSLLQENLEAQPFDFIRDPVVRTELTCSQYFIEGYEQTNLRRTEDLVALDYEPVLTDFPVGHNLIPIQDELRKEFKYLDDQVKYYEKRLFGIWAKYNHQDLFNLEPIETRWHHPYQIERLLHQFELESIRYLKFNKYHLIQAKTEQYDLSIFAKNNLYTSWKQWSYPKPKSERSRERSALESRDPTINYIYDYNLSQFDRKFERHWTLESELKYRRECNLPIRYPLVPLRHVRKENWVEASGPANTRFVFSDLGFDPQTQRYGRRIEDLDRLNRDWRH